ncbi:hypothetical protein EXIGLDRAFT_484573 [Exidia glandulosa HHB12029]|uniref:DUF6535 domain-containing protein n=1 Tax=Exidia glandulosa HHB12029 TaxID=1314781 RepID=A0A165PKC6_EXIGL|nr:hypothetical protein EXIGLDRAFT_484573 [Exidia glandulosa HHB12029]
MDYLGGSISPRQEPVSWPKPPVEEQDTDFKRKYPPDPLGDEMVPSARVWRVYHGEAMAHDTAMLDGWSKTVDVLLIFAGLFSAVATAFLIESYKALTPNDSAAYISTALYLLVSTNTGSVSTSSLGLPPPPPISSSVTSLTRWTNGLWFTSLILSLGVALLCILVKQWIGEYVARNAASAAHPLHWARRRQLFFQAMMDWPVAELVSVLPLLLHLALFLFFAGTTGFLWDSDIALSIWVAVLSSGLGVFYVVCTLVPLWIPECPTSTPLVSVIRWNLVRIRRFALRTAVSVHAAVYDWVHALLPARRHVESGVGDLEPGLVYVIDAPHAEPPHPAVSTWHATLSRLATYNAQTSNQSVLQRRLDFREIDLEVDVLRWLIISVSDSDAVAAGLQAIGWLPPGSPLIERLVSDERIADYDWTSAFMRTVNYYQPPETARVVRSMLRIQRPFELPDEVFRNRYFVLFHYLEQVDYPDMQFLSLFYRRYYGYERSAVSLEAPLEVKSLSITTTVMLVVEAVDLDFDDLLAALTWCDFGRLLNDEWDLVIGGICAGAPPGSVISRPRWSLKQMALLDILCQVLPASGSTAPLIQRLITKLFAWITSDNLDAIYHHPHILRYLTSDDCISQPLNERMTQHLVYMFWVIPKYGAPSPFVEELLLRVLGVALYKSPSALDDSAQRHGAANICSGALERYFDAQQDSRPFLSVTLRSILRVVPLPVVKQTLWERLRRYDTFSFGLARTLAIALAAAARHGLDVAHDEDAFLSRLRLQDLLDMWQRFVENSAIPEGMPHDVDEFPIHAVHIVQHCIELRPTWWLDNLRVIHDDPSDSQLKRFVAEIEALLAGLGPCTDCLGVPLGWEEEAEDHSSVCTFNPIL